MYSQRGTSKCVDLAAKLSDHTMIIIQKWPPKSLINFHDMKYVWNKMKTALAHSKILLINLSRQNPIMFPKTHRADLNIEHREAQK